jgi:hypothetical protein
MTNKAQRHEVARDAAATLAAQLLVQRCRYGAEATLMPQARHLAIASDALAGWLQRGGFAGEDAAAHTKTAAQGRRSRVHIEDISEEW